jgi:ABC-type spermidine/putrescine transport system permease subunit II
MSAHAPRCSAADLGREILDPPILAARAVGITVTPLERITYATLKERVERLAAGLARTGVTKATGAGSCSATRVHAIPCVVVIMRAALRTFDIALENAAMGLGASWLRAIRRVTLPQMRPALVSAIFLAFISSFDELVLAMFLGGANMTLPKKMFDNILNAIDPTIAAVSVLQILIVSIALLVSARFGTEARPAL